MGCTSDLSYDLSEPPLSDACRVLAYVAELGAHDPRAVIEYIDKEVPAPNEPVIAEYLKALTKTDALSQYTSQGPLK